MLLTDHEREFLTAFIAEATTDPFKGPVTAELHRRDIYYTDLAHLLAAYYRESNMRPEKCAERPQPMPPSCPWQDRGGASRRDREVEIELARETRQAVP